MKRLAREQSASRALRVPAHRKPLAGRQRINSERQIKLIEGGQRGRDS